jgi:uncharacterized protein YchJ
MIQYLPILGSWALGTLIGALLRQPEINRLKKQVKILHNEISRLKTIILEQKRQFEVLRNKYTALKAWNFIEKARNKTKLYGTIIHAYALNDYLLLSNEVLNKQELSDDQKVFVNLYDRLINKPQDFSKNEFSIFEKIVIKWHYYEVKKMIFPDMKIAYKAIEG